MVEMDLLPMVRLNGGTRVTSYLVEHGFTYGEARKLSRGDTLVQIRDRTVQHLCEALRCTPSDLFCWRGKETDALAVLNRRRPKPLHALLEGKTEVERMALWQKVTEWNATHTPQPRVVGGRLKLDVQRLVWLRTSRSPWKELQDMGLTEMEARGVLRADRYALRMKVLTKLCEGFGCLPDDLFSFEGPEGHVLSGLQRSELLDVSSLPAEVLRGFEN